MGTASRSSAWRTFWTSPGFTSAGTASSTSLGAFSLSFSIRLQTSSRVSSSSAWDLAMLLRCVSSTPAASLTM